jgi:hypothetical protein
MTNAGQKKIKAQIKKLVRDYYLNKPKEKFNPGRTLIRQANCVCDPDTPFKSILKEKFSFMFAAKMAW